MDEKGEMKLSIALQHQIHWFVQIKYGHTLLLKMTKLLTMSTAGKNVVRILGISWDIVLLKDLKNYILLKIFQDYVVFTLTLVNPGDTADPSPGHLAIQTWIVRSADVG